MRNKFLFISLFLGLSVLISTACKTYNLERKLPPNDREWLSVVRYTISKDEKRVFLELPASERESFKNEFWKKRDPDPSTEYNEFKEEYYSRVEYANENFIGGGRPGYLQDRGRIHIYFGPPTQRERYPGRNPPYEIWYYGTFPIMFVDQYYNGDYILTTQNLSILHEIGSALGQINEGRDRLISRHQDGKSALDIDIKVARSESGERAFFINVPYKGIWFAEKDGKLHTILSVSVRVFGADKEEVWTFQKDYTLSMTDEDLAGKIDESYPLYIPFSLEEGAYSSILEIKNSTGGEKLSRTFEFNI